jgi:DNA-binding protein Fis
MEDAIIDWALVQTGSRQAAAGVLGVKRTTLVEKLRRRALPANDVEHKLAS